MSKRQSQKNDHLPPLLARLIWAAKHADEDWGGGDISAIPRALEELGTLASWVVPVHGVFVPTASDIRASIEQVARSRFHGKKALRELRAALDVVADFRQRDSISTALNNVRSAEGDAHFYAGIAFGITLAGLTRD